MVDRIARGMDAEKALNVRGTPRLLVIVNGQTLGSTLMSVPTIRALQRHLGVHSEIWVMFRQPAQHTPPAIELLRAAIPVAGLLPMSPKPGWLSLARIYWQLRHLRFDAVACVETDGIHQSRLRRYQHFFQLAGIRQRFGFDRPTVNLASASTAPLPSIALLRLHHMAGYGVHIAVESDIASPLLPLPPERWPNPLGGTTGIRRVAICPGTRAPANAWSLERFGELGRRLLALGGYELVVCGGEAERSLGEQLVREWGQGISLAGSCSVLESAAVLRDCAFMVGLDTGTTHLAAAVGTPCIVLQGGRTFARTWDPLGPGHVVIRYPVPCAGCGLSACPLTLHPCMRGIGVDQVWTAVLHMHERLNAAGLANEA